MEQHRNLRLCSTCIRNWHRLCQPNFDTFCAVTYPDRMPDTSTAPPNLRSTKREEARTRILDAFIKLLTNGAADLSHDAVADCAGVARRTVYRYFPDRQALMDGALLRVRDLAGPQVTYPKSPEELLS